MKIEMCVLRLLCLFIAMFAQAGYGIEQSNNAASEAKVNSQATDSVSTLISLSEKNLWAGNLDSATYFIELGLAHPDVSAEQSIALLSMRGTAYYYRTDYQSAIAAHLEAMRICDQNSLEKQKARVFNNLGIAYIKLEDWTKAEENMVRALEISKTFEIKRGELYCLGNLGIIYKNQAKYELAIDAYQKSIALNSEMDDKKAMSRNLNNLGTLFEEQGQLDAAFQSYEKALHIGDELQDNDLKAMGRHNLASIQSKRKEYPKAESNFLKCLAISTETQNKDYQKSALKGLSTLYASKGEFARALDYFKEYAQVKDSILNAQNLHAISELEIEYETEKKEKELLILTAQSEKDAVDKLLQNKKITQLYLGLLLAFIIFVLSFVIYRQHTNNKLKHAQIKAIEQTQNHERKRIAQDLHDSVGGALASIKMRVESFADTGGEPSTDLRNLSTDISNIAGQLRQISHDIMPGELLKFGLVSAAQSNLDRISKSGFVAQLHAHGISNKMDFEIEINLYRIMLEGIQNVLKHAEASILNIHLNQHPKSISLLIEDDGRGFNAKAQSGFGLDSIRNRVDLLKGNFHIDSNDSSGTTLSIEIPLR